MNFYKRHIGDYIKDAGHLKLLEHGVYARLMDVYYTRESGIPQDKAARLIGASTRPEMEALKFVLDEFFTLVDGVWIQKRCEEEIAVANAKAEKNRENGKAGGRPKKQKPEENPNGSVVGNHVGSENNLSQTPDSRLQTPDQNPDQSSQASTGVGATPPEREHPSQPVQLDRNVQIALLLRAQGVNVTAQNPIVAVTWAQNPKVTDDVLNIAVAKAKATLEKQGRGTVSESYLVPIVEQIVAQQDAPAPEPKPQQQPVDRWWTSDSGIQRKAKELGIRILQSHSWDDVKTLCFDKERELKAQGGKS